MKNVSVKKYQATYTCLVRCKMVSNIGWNVQVSSKPPHNSCKQT